VLLFAKGLKNAYPELDVTLGELDVAPMQIQGPRSKELMHDLVGPQVDDLKYYFFMRTEVRGIPVVLTRTGWTSEVGYELYLLDPHRGKELWAAVMEAARHTVSDRQVRRTFDVSRAPSSTGAPT
jgi:aminomethyltransferase